MPNFLGKTQNWDTERIRPLERASKKTGTESSLQKVLCWGVRDSIVIGRERICSLHEKSQQEQWKGHLTKEAGQSGKEQRVGAVHRDLCFLFMLICHFLSHKRLLRFVSFVTSCCPRDRCLLDPRAWIPPQNCVCTLKFKDSYIETPERFWGQSRFGGLGKGPVPLISRERLPQQSSEGQSSVLHWTRNCKFWLFGEFTERSPGLVPTHTASNNRFVHNAGWGEEKERKEKRIWNIVSKSLWMNFNTWWNDWSTGCKIWSDKSKNRVWFRM